MYICGKLQIRKGIRKRIFIMYFFWLIHSGLKEEARWYLSKFSWGHSFITLNETLLNKYAQCKDNTEVLATQNEYIEQAEKERADRRAAATDYPPAWSSSSSETESDEDVLPASTKPATETELHN